MHTLIILGLLTVSCLSALPASQYNRYEMTQDQQDNERKTVMHMRAVGEDRHVEMEADYKPAAEDILTSCGNNSNARANAWVDDLTGGMKRALRETLLEGLRNAAQIELFCLAATHSSRHLLR